VVDHGLARSVAPAPENLDILAWVGDRLVPREMANVSAFDSAVQVNGSAASVPLRFDLAQLNEGRRMSMSFL
jgi:hypothetical protein